MVVHGCLFLVFLAFFSHKMGDNLKKESYFLKSVLQIYLKVEKNILAIQQLKKITLWAATIVLKLFHLLLSLVLDILMWLKYRGGAIVQGAKYVLFYKISR